MAPSPSGQRRAPLDNSELYVSGATRALGTEKAELGAAIFLGFTKSPGHRHTPSGQHHVSWAARAGSRGSMLHQQLGGVVRIAADHGEAAA